MRKIFRFIEKAYKNKKLVESRLARNQIHFYTMITAIVFGDLLDKIAEKVLIRKLATLGQIVDGQIKAPQGVAEHIKKYLELSAKHTTHPSRRKERQDLFIKMVEVL